jgi:hypothetical protein
MNKRETKYSPTRDMSMVCLAPLDGGYRYQMVADIITSRWETGIGFDDESIDADIDRDDWEKLDVSAAGIARLHAMSDIALFIEFRGTCLANESELDPRLELARIAEERKKP